MRQPSWSIEQLMTAWRLVARLHDGQKYGGPEPEEYVEYLNHIGGVVFEVLNALQHEKDINADLAIHCALLHDTIEDTEMTYEGVREKFGLEVADGVLALTKNDDIEGKREKMLDSLSRIRQQPREVAMVKMADRIVNLQAPPFYWDKKKKEAYRNEAILIHEQLKGASDYLAGRLAEKIEVYRGYF